MSRQWGHASTGIGVAGTVTIGVLTIPMLRRLPEQSRVSIEGITTIAGASKPAGARICKGGNWWPIRAASRGQKIHLLSSQYRGYIVDSISNY